MWKKLFRTSTAALAFTIHPLPVEYNVDQLRSLITIPADQLSYWDDPLPTARAVILHHQVSSPKDVLVSPQYPPPRSKVRPTCSSLHGPVCEPLLSSRVPSLLLEFRGIPPNSIYGARLTNLLKTLPAPKLWLKTSREDINCPNVSFYKSDNDGSYRLQRIDPSLWHRFLHSNPDGAELSRILLAAEFDKPLEVPEYQFNDWNQQEKMHNLSAMSATPNDRVYSVPPFSHEARVWKDPKVLDRAFLDSERYWQVPGALPKHPRWPSSKPIITSLEPGLILISDLYSVGGSLNEEAVSGISPLGPYSGKLVESISKGLQWVRQSPIAAEHVGGDIHDQMLITDASKTLIAGTSATEGLQKNRDRFSEGVDDYLWLEPFKNHSPESISSQLRKTTEDEIELLDLIPQDSPWDLYAAAMQISPEAVWEWHANGKKASKRRPTAPLMAVKEVKKSQILHPLNLLLQVQKLHSMIFRYLFRAIETITSFTTRVVASSIGLKKQWSIIESRIHSARKTVIDRPPPGTRPDKTESQKATDRIWAATQATNAYKALVSSKLSPITFSRYTGICESWDIQQSVPPWMDNVPFAYSNGLARPYAAMWKGYWATKENSLGVQLHSELGEIQINPYVVIERLFLRFDKVEHSASASAGTLVGLAIQGLRIDDDQERQAKHVQWTVRLRPSEISALSEEGKPLNILEKRWTSGSLMKRVNIIEFKWHSLPSSNISAKPPTNKLRPLAPRVELSRDIRLKVPNSSIPFSLSIHKIDFHGRKRLFVADYQTLDNIKERSAKFDYSQLLYKAKLHPTHYSTIDGSYPAVLISSKTDLHEILEESSHQKSSDERAADAKRNNEGSGKSIGVGSSRVGNAEDFSGQSAGVTLQSLSERDIREYKRSNPPVPFSLRLKEESAHPFGRGLTSPRGFNRVRAACLAPERSLISILNQSLKTGRTAIAGDGAVHGQDERHISSLLEVHAFDLPPEAPVLTLLMANKYKVAFRYRIHDFWTRILYREDEDRNDISSQAANDSLVPWMKTLKRKLENSPEVQKLLANFDGAILSSDGDKSAEASLRDEGRLDDHIKRIERLTGEGLDKSADRIAEHHATALTLGAAEGQRALPADVELEDTIRDLIESSILMEGLEGEDINSIFRGINVMAVIEDVETGEMVTKSVSLSLADILDKMDLENKQSSEVESQEGLREEIGLRERQTDVGDEVTPSEDSGAAILLQIGQRLNVSLTHPWNITYLPSGVSVRSFVKEEETGSDHEDQSRFDRDGMRDGERINVVDRIESNSLHAIEEDGTTRGSASVKGHASAREADLPREPEVTRPSATEERIMSGEAYSSVKTLKDEIDDEDILVLREWLAEVAETPLDVDEDGNVEIEIAVPIEDGDVQYIPVTVPVGVLKSAESLLEWFEGKEKEWMEDPAELLSAMKNISSSMYVAEESDLQVFVDEWLSEEEK